MDLKFENNPERPLTKPINIKYVYSNIWIGQKERRNAQIRLFGFAWKLMLHIQIYGLS